MTRPIRISIHALGGQGGGVLADWIVDMAEHEGWIAQSTSVPGVAQRTGATLYYVELAPPSGGTPVLALMPTPGDVDIVLAAELMEAGRAIARGLVTSERTVLIASSHRVFAISEKSAMGDGVVSPAAVLDAARQSAKRLVLADFAQIAERNRSVISASLFGGLAGSGALPFPSSAFEEAIRRGERGIASSLAAFAEGMTAKGSETGPSPTPQHWPTPHAELPASAEPLARLGVERLTDYQDGAYAALYLERLRAVAAADRALGGAEMGHELTAAAARHLALWMSYEDAIRVAELKTRPDRLGRVTDEGAGVAHVTEFLHPRFEEICDILPRRLGERLLGSMRARRMAAPLTARGRFVTTTRVSGFLLLWAIARLRRFRRGTYRFAVENARIESWLESAINAARSNYALGVEVLKLQRLVKGYGDTHARGWRSFGTIMALIPRLQQQRDAAAHVALLHEAALKDDEGLELARAVRKLERTTGAGLSAPVEMVA
jgi:indolepyruvate ferredoxin oxidoreductase beta subunit